MTGRHGARSLMGVPRVLHVSGELPSPFKDLSKAYGISDGDLMQAINKAEQPR